MTSRAAGGRSRPQSAEADKLQRAEEALAESERTHQRFLESLTGRYFFYRRDREGAFTHLSPSVSQVLGYHPDEYRAHYSDMLTESPLNQDVAARTEGTLRGERQPPYEVEVRAKDGSSRRLEVTEYPVTGPDATVAFVEGIARDVTDTRRAEALRDGQNRILEMIATGAPMREVLTALAVFVESQTPDMLASILLLDRDGVHMRHGAAPSLPAAYVQAVDGAPIGPHDGSCGTAIYLKQVVIVSDILDDPRWHEYGPLAVSFGLRACWSTPIFARDGAVLGSFAMYYRRPQVPGPEELRFAELASHLAAIAIEHQGAADALRASQEQYRTFFQENLAANYVAAPDGRLLACNPAYARLFGFASIEQALRSSLWSRFPAPGVVEWFRGVLQGRGKLQGHEHGVSRQDGSVLQVVETAFGRFDERGELVEICGYVIDETERRAAEAQLRQAQKIEAVGQLAGGVAHDFNNLLGVITGYCDLLLRDEAHPGRPRLEQIARAAERAADLTRQLLAFSRKQVLEAKVLDLNCVLADIDRMLRRLIGDQVQLVMGLDKGLGLIKADPGQIEQVVVNLAVNARDAMPEGGRLLIKTSNVEIDEEYVRLHPDAAVGSHAMLAVSDTGLGMDEATRARIFEPFFTTKAPGKGTGLGLSTVYGIVKQSGGYIAVDSEPGQGATFTVYLPLVREAAASSGPPPRAAGRELGGSETILLLEDEESLRIMLSELLRVAGYQVLECGSSEEALAAAVQSSGRPIDLMLADVVIPRMRGHEVAARIQGAHPRMKLLYMSGYSLEILGLQNSFPTGLEFIAKPFSVEAILRRVRQVLDTWPARVE